MGSRHRKRQEISCKNGGAKIGQILPQQRVWLAGRKNVMCRASPVNICRQYCETQFKHSVLLSALVRRTSPQFCHSFWYEGQE